MKNPLARIKTSNFLSRAIFGALLTAATCITAYAQSQTAASLSARVAQEALTRFPGGHLNPNEPFVWDYQFGELFDGMHALWYNTADPRYYQFIKESIDAMVERNGVILGRGYVQRPFDQELLGRQLLLLYGVTEQKKYYLAAGFVRDRLNPCFERLSASCQRDNFFITSPFLAQYASTFQRPQDFAAITRLLMQVDPQPHDLLRMGLYLSALVDSLPWYPANAPGRAQLLKRLESTAKLFARAQVRSTGLWPASLTVPRTGESLFESDSASRVIYAMAKSMRLGYLPQSYHSTASRAWKAVQKSMVPTFDHMSPGGAGTFLLAATEMEDATSGLPGLGKTVLLDAWYNSQTRTNAAGQTEFFHYKWTDYSNNGFALLGHIFRSTGARTETLASAPTLSSLKGANYYIIVSPDNPAKNPHPHYMNEHDADQIAAWVKRGGVLVMMENDRDNADIPHFDLLADKFGLHFNNVLTHHVIGSEHEMGKILLNQPTGFFAHPHQLFMKDTSSLTLSHGAHSLLEWKGDVLMAVAHYGKGTVFAVTDPWLYNEYTDGRNLEPGYDNFAGGKEFVHWLLQQ